MGEVSLPLPKMYSIHPQGAAFLETKVNAKVKQLRAKLEALAAEKQKTEQLLSQELLAMANLLKTNHLAATSEGKQAGADHQASAGQQVSADHQAAELQVLDSVAEQANKRQGRAPVAILGLGNLFGEVAIFSGVR